MITHEISPRSRNTNSHLSELLLNLLNVLLVLLGLTLGPSLVPGELFLHGAQLGGKGPRLHSLLLQVSADLLNLRGIPVIDIKLV